MTPDVATTLLDCLWHWERVQPAGVYCTQPVAPGIVVDYRWDVVADQILESLGLDQVRAAVTGPLPTEVAAWYRRIGLALIEGSAFTSFGLAAPEPAFDPTTAAA